MCFRGVSERCGSEFGGRDKRDRAAEMRGDCVHREHAFHWTVEFNNIWDWTRVDG